MLTDEDMAMLAVIKDLGPVKIVRAARVINEAWKVEKQSRRFFQIMFLISWTLWIVTMWNGGSLWK